jgi:tetratricopeptide (TPR) repeat protein
MKNDIESPSENELLSKKIEKKFDSLLHNEEELNENLKQKLENHPSQKYKREYSRVIADNKIMKIELELLRDLERTLNISEKDARKLQEEVDVEYSKGFIEALTPVQNEYLSDEKSRYDNDHPDRPMNQQRTKGSGGELDFLREQLENGNHNGPMITWESLYEKGMEYFEAGLYDKSLYYYDNALKLEPKSFEVWASKGLALFWLDRWKDAMICINKSLKLNSQYCPAWNHKGIIFKSRRQFKLAVKCYNNAIRCDPAYASAWFNKGFLLQHLGNFEKAIKYYDKTIALEPDNIEAQYNRNECFKSIKVQKQGLVDL